MVNRRDLISDGYLALQRKMHTDRKDYGISGYKYAQEIATAMELLGVKELLDYGAGRQTLREALPQYVVHSYDPCIEHLSGEPEPHDMVVCTDVMEHIEEDRVDNVLDHIKELTRKVVFFQISTRLARKTLPNGENAHICVHPKEWWLNKLMTRWSVDSFTNNMDESLVAICSIRKVQ